MNRKKVSSSILCLLFLCLFVRNAWADDPAEPIKLNLNIKYHQYLKPDNKTTISARQDVIAGRIEEIVE